MSDAADSKTVIQTLAGITGILVEYQPVNVNSNINVNANREKCNNVDTNRVMLPDHLQQKNDKFFAIILVENCNPANDRRWKSKEEF